MLRWAKQSTSCGGQVRPAAWSSQAHLSEHMGGLSVATAISVPHCQSSSSSHSEPGGEAGSFHCFRPIHL